MTDNHTSDLPPFLFCFGLGYSALALARILMPLGWKIAGTTTDPAKQELLQQAGIDAFLFGNGKPLPRVFATIGKATHILLSIPPQAGGDPVFDLHGADIAKLRNLKWLGYLSTTGVYGNRDGEWVDETTKPAPTSRRGDLRLLAEEQWRSLMLEHGIQLHIFRLSGIYGQGRSAIDSLRAGTARRIEKPGHVFNRIHVEDIAQVLQASMTNPEAGAVYNLADDEPAPSHEVVAYAATLIGMDIPPAIPYEKADLAPMVGSFYKDNKRVRNDLIKQKLGITLRYPNYRAGLDACLAAEKTEDPLKLLSAGGASPA